MDAPPNAEHCTRVFPLSKSTEIKIGKKDLLQNADDQIQGKFPAAVEDGIPGQEFNDHHGNQRGNDRGEDLYRIVQIQGEIEGHDDAAGEQIGQLGKNQTDQQGKYRKFIQFCSPPS